MDGAKRLTNAVLREYSILAIRDFDKPEPIVFLIPLSILILLMCHVWRYIPIVLRLYKCISILECPEHIRQGVSPSHEKIAKAGSKTTQCICRQSHR